ncbi:choice-of-anchor L domain-containing protein [uncultured Paracoccus sp.]|uniref:choice-of-anchor L domain-containing protein n=1 Tax=uncultured Paracoccus sp. TaxID=189685 RepID=UPI0025E99AE3|nr:choice-of-anchor L domain-containing protein [uncultured Paracoccus sp.]
MKRFGLTLLGALMASVPAHAISVTPTNDAFALANTLFLNLPGLQVTGATLSGQFGQDTLGQDFGQAGVYTNLSGTYGLPNAGLVLSSGNVADYGDGPNTSTGKSTAFGIGASADQQALLQPITGQDSHFDVVQLDISFNVGADVQTVSFFSAFGSEEFPEYVGQFVDGFGLFVNGQNVAGVQPSTGGPNLPVNIDHPDFTSAIGGTQLDGMLAPNGNPVLRFDVPVNAGQINNFTIILADANDSQLDTTIYLSSFFAQGSGSDGRGATEFDPVLPSNPPDPITGAFVIELPEVEEAEVIWIDPPIAVGYSYDAGSAQFDLVTAPSLATVADLDGYIITVDGQTAVLAAGATLNFFDVFGVTPSSFTLSGIDPDLALDPANPAAFPVGVSFTEDLFAGAEVIVTPITDGSSLAPVPLPASGLLLIGGLAAMGAARRRKAA